MTRAAIYARFSTERQSESSTEDQARVCRARALELELEVERLVDAIAAVGVSPALAERLKKAEAALVALDEPQARAAPADVCRDLRTRLRAVALDLASALARDVGRAREILRGLLGEIRLEPEGPAVYAEIESAAEGLVVAAGGASMGRVAGGRNLTRLRVR